MTNSRDLPLASFLFIYYSQLYKVFKRRNTLLLFLDKSEIKILLSTSHSISVHLIIEAPYKTN